jgi:hypothetical protein
MTLTNLLAHARMRLRIIGVSVYFDYMRVADAMLLATTEVVQMQSQIFYFLTGKI